MATKKKYLGGLKVLLSLLFVILLGTFSTCYASFADPFTQAEVDQLNTFFNYTLTAEDVNKGYNLLKEYYPNMDKRNVLFVKIRPNGYLNALYIFANNGTFSNSLDYVAINHQSSYDYYWRCTSSSDFIFSNYYMANLYSNGTTTFLATIDSGNDGYEILQPLQGIASPTLTNSTLDYTSIVTTMSTQSFYFKNPATSAYEPVFSKYYIVLDDTIIPPDPEQPSGDVSGDSSGDSPNGGFIDYTNYLNNIDNSINIQGQNIVNTLSGESQAIRETISGETDRIINFFSGDVDMSNTVITSGDITNSLGFELASDPYDNFWITLTNNLKTALLGSKRSIDVTFRGSTWTISLDEYLVLPAWLTIILTPISTCLLVWILVRQWKLIFDKISSGNVDSLLKDNSEEGISNLF